MEIHNIIDSARDILVGKLPNPQDQIDTITYTLMYKFMSDIDDESASLGGKRVYFQCDYEKYGWHNLMRADGQQQLILFRDAIESMSRNPNLPQLFREIFSGALLKFNDPRTLRLFLKEMDKFTHGENDDLGDAYEYLLSIMSSQGGLGQFRTPRHIIEFIVQLVNPDKEDKIIDPACGTSGFLISAYKHIMAMYDGKDSNGKQNNEQRLTAQELERIHKNFRGFDIDPTMIRTARVNMYLHGFKTPDIIEHDTLTSEDFWNERYDVILANPPFMTPKGGIQPHKKFSVQAKRSEVLFTDYIATHLKPSGRAGFIVPEGIIFQSGNAYKQLRKNLVENGLYAVVSLPSGVFMPYSGVKTSIIFIDAELRHKSDVLFVEIKNTGISLGATSREIDENDLPEALKIIENYKNNKAITSTIAFSVPKKQILDEPKVDLSAGRYKQTNNNFSGKHPTVKIGDVAEIFKGKSSSTKTKEGEYTLFLTAAESKTADHYDFEGDGVALPLISALGHGKAEVKRMHRVSGKFALANLLCFIKPNKEKLDVDFLNIILNNSKTELAKLMTGAANVSMKIEDVADFLIPLPPLSVQKEIVEQVSAKQRTIEAARAIMNLELRITKAEIGEDFQMMKLGEVAEIVNGGTPKTEKSEYWKEEVLWVTPAEMDDSKGIYLPDSKRKISNLGLENSSAHIVPEKSVILSTRAPIGYLKINAVPMAFNQGCRGIICDKEKLLPEYLYFYLLTQRKELNLLGTGATFKELSATSLKSFQIPVPPLSIQEKIVSKYAEIEQIKKGNMRLVEILEEEIKALINELINS